MFHTGCVLSGPACHPRTALRCAQHSLRASGGILAGRAVWGARLLLDHAHGHLTVAAIITVGRIGPAPRGLAWPGRDPRRRPASHPTHRQPLRDDVFVPFPHRAARLLAPALRPLREGAVRSACGEEGEVKRAHSLPGVDATTVSVLEAAGMPTIEHVLAFVPSELRADPRVEQVRLPPLTAHQRYCVRRDAPTRIVTLPSLPLPHLCHPWSSCRA